ncbi:MAG: hypothetical protein IT307_17330 [Chloroflexi bacterium]|nr:hypothetical protein [Chloroflexota bacterium]
MAHDYTPKLFLRQAPNASLKAYFDRKTVLAGIDWAALKETEVDVVYDAWQALDKQQREEIESDFRTIHDLATSDGVRAMIEEGQFHKKDLGPELDALDGHHAKVLCVFLNHPRVFLVAGMMDRADHMDGRYRRKRKDMPKKAPDLTATARQALSASLAAYYWQKQGRGRNCKMDVYLRGGRHHYFFVYPEDYAGTFIGYGPGGEFIRRAQQPAFDVVFAYDPVDGTLDLFALGDKRIKQDLQEIFARTILHEEIGPENKNSQPYELNGLKRRDFAFTPRPGDGLTAIRVRSLRLSVKGNPMRRITVEGDLRTSAKDVYDLMDQVLDKERLPLANVDVDHATLQAEFAGIVRGKPKRRTFGVSKNSCNLKEKPEDLIIMECLKLSEVARV